MADNSLEKVLQTLRQNVSKIENSTGLTGHIDLIYGALDKVRKILKSTQASQGLEATGGSEQIGAAIKSAQLAKASLTSYTKTVRQWERLVGVGRTTIHAAEFGSRDETIDSPAKNGTINGGGCNNTANAKADSSFPNVESVRYGTLEDLRNIIPNNWIVEKPRKVRGGIRFRNPDAKGEQIIYEPGWPKASDPVHAGPYIRVSHHGHVNRIPLRKDG